MEGTSVSTHTEYEDFYRREFSTLAVLAGTVCGNRALGEDIAQEALTRAHDQWEKLATYDKPGAWLRRVAINLAIGQKRRSTSEANAVERLQPDLRTIDPDPRLGDPAVWAAVDALAPRQRAVVALRYLEDQSLAEIAHILEISVSAATSNLHKARTNLATMLGDSHG